MPLTELQIRHLKPRERAYRVTDGNGLTLTITPAGGKLWHVRYRYNGKQQIYSLGILNLSNWGYASRHGNVRI